MNRYTTLALLATSLAASLSAGAADVGISVQISQPGIYGRIDIGRYPQPQVVVQQPVLVMPAPHVLAPQPVYMWVPPGHRKDWKKHCGAYGACGVPVYFVSDDWYGTHVQPHAKGNGKGNNGKGNNGKGKGHD